MLSLTTYEPAHSSCWQGRKDSLPHERFFQQVKLIDLQKESLAKANNEIAILGFCSDEGIRRNEGRIGAKSGPLKLREQLAKLAFHGTKEFIDVGNILCDKDLEFAQDEFAKIVSHCHQKAYKTLAFGGGHEIAFGHFKGLNEHYSNLGIINFDAHFDLRPLKEDKLGNSGTPFRQIADLTNQRPFGYCCLGIQPIGNTRSLFKAADELGVSYLSALEIQQQSLDAKIHFLNDFLQKHDHIYLSFCLDVFADYLAPGVSAPQALGLTFLDVIPLLKYILQTGKVVSIDIAELSPPFDIEQKTARLAASLIAELLNYY